MNNAIFCVITYGVCVMCVFGCVCMCHVCIWVCVCVCVVVHRCVLCKSVDININLIVLSSILFSWWFSKFGWTNTFKWSVASLRHVFWYWSSKAEVKILCADSASTNRMCRFTSNVQSPFTGYRFLRNTKYSLPLGT